MKKIYIVLTYTGTVLANIVKFYTREKYSHVSIGLDSELNELYSFGRLNPYNPYKGGFIHEGINKGTFARFRNTIGAVYSLEIEDKQYEKIVEIIENIKNNKEKYKFNIIGLFLVSIKRKYKKENSFYCAEFVKYLLEQSFNKKILPEIVKPMDFLELDNLELVYEGVFRDYINNNEGYQSNVIG